jgi:hypothetical protein
MAAGYFRGLLDRLFRGSKTGSVYDRLERVERIIHDYRRRYEEWYGLNPSRLDEIEKGFLEELDRIADSREKELAGAVSYDLITSIKKGGPELTREDIKALAHEVKVFRTEMFKDVCVGKISRVSNTELGYQSFRVRLGGLLHDYLNKREEDQEIAIPESETAS